MKYISNLLSREYAEIVEPSGNVFKLPSEVQIGKRGLKVSLLALGDVGGTLLMGLRLMGGELIDSIGIFDLNENVLRRYEREINQIAFPDGRVLPKVEILTDDELFDCDAFIFCASKGVPPLTASGDVRMAQLEANKSLVKIYADKAIDSGFNGLFAVVSDPVDPLCAAAVDAGLVPSQVQGYGLGVMNGRARYFAEKDERFSSYLVDGRAFGPHGEDLVIANSINDYDDAISLELTDLTVKSNMVTRSDGFKPYIAPAMSSGAISILATIQGEWNYSSHYLGEAFLGCRNRRVGDQIEIENLPLDDKLFARIENAYNNLK